MGCLRLTYQKITSKTEGTPIFEMGGKQVSDYYLFGMFRDACFSSSEKLSRTNPDKARGTADGLSGQMPGRHGSDNSEGEYRYGYQGQEVHGEVKGEGNSVNYKYRMHCSSRLYGNPRVGRWLSMDRVKGKKPYLSPYQSMKNNPLSYLDPDGNDEYLTYVYTDETTGKSKRIDMPNAVSTKVMTDGNGHENVHSNYYYDFRKVRHVTKNEDGTYIVKESYEILYEDGHKDFDLAYGSVNVKKNEHTKDEADGWMWVLTKSEQTQPSGYRFTTSGGSNSTRTRILSEEEVESRDIEDFITAMASLPLGSLSNPDASAVGTIGGLVDKLNEVKEEVNKTGDASTGNPNYGGADNSPKWEIIDRTGNKGKPHSTVTAESDKEIKKDSLDHNGIKIRVSTIKK